MQLCGITLTEEIILVLPTLNTVMEYLSTPKGSK